MAQRDKLTCELGKADGSHIVAAGLILWLRLKLHR